MLRTVVVAFAALVLMSSCSGDDGGDDSASREQELRSTVESAFTAFRDAKTDELYDYFSQDFHDRCDRDDFRRVMAIATAFLGELNDGVFTIEAVTFEDDDHATVTVKFEPGNEPAGFDFDETSGFLDVWVREDGEWKTDVEDENPCDVSSGFETGDDGDATPVTGPGTSREEAVGVGETVRSGDLEVTVTDVDLDATAEVVAQDGFAEQLAPGNRFVLMTVRARHAGEGAETLQVSSGDFKITGSNNILYDNFSDEHSCGFIDDDLSGELFAGGEVEGKVCFQLAEDESDLILVVDPFFSFEDSDRRFIALE